MARTCLDCLHSGDYNFQGFIRKEPYFHLLVVPSRNSYEDGIRVRLVCAGPRVLVAHGKGAEVEGIDGKRMEHPWQWLGVVV